MGVVRPDNYVGLQGWMVTDLGLRGNELVIYAVIFCLSQGGDTQYFEGSQQYLADWIGSTKKTVRSVLSELIDKGLIEKEDTYANGVKFCKYRCSDYPGRENFTPGGREKFTHKTEDIETISNKENHNPNGLCQKKGRKPSSYDSILDASGLDDSVRDVFLEFIKMRKLIKSPMTDRALTLMVNKLKTLDETPDGQIAILNQSIENSWKGIFPLRQERMTADDIRKQKEAEDMKRYEQWEREANERKRVHETEEYY